MTRLFRNPDPRWSDYLCLAIFAAAYIAIVMLLISPQTVIESPAFQMSLTN